MLSPTGTSIFSRGSLNDTGATSPFCWFTLVTVVWVEVWWLTGHWFLFECVPVYSVCVCTCVILLLCGNASELHTCSLIDHTTLVQRNEPLSHMSFNSDFIRYTEKVNTIGEPIEWRAEQQVGMLMTGKWVEEYIYPIKRHGRNGLIAWGQQT